MKVTILGCGPSYGIPTARFGFGSCDEGNPKNFRTRTSLLLQTRGKTILFDTAPELRLQLIRSQVKKIDAVIWTHLHGDHVYGIDDLRCYALADRNSKDVSSIPAFVHLKEKEDFEQRFYFYLKPMSYLGQEKPILDMHYISAGEVFNIDDVLVYPILQNHGQGESLGFRVGDFAYNTDLIDFVDYPLENLKGIKLWVLDCVTTHENNKHLFLEKVLKWAQIVQPERLILTHMGTRMDYDSLCQVLPKGIEPAYDGMEVEL